MQERTANREGGFCSIQFDADFEALAEGKGDILGISAMVWIWPRQNYRKTPGSLEAEAWAQFGREYFDNAPDVKEMFEELFPNLNSHAMMALKGLIWYVERSCYRRTPGSFSPVCE